MLLNHPKLHKIHMMKSTWMNLFVNLLFSHKFQNVLSSNTQMQAMSFTEHERNKREGGGDV